MRMSCNGCRVLRKGCSDNCSIRPCLQWIKNPESQANATVFLAKFYGRAGLMNLINAGPDHLRPAIFRSLLYEACGRIVNPIYGSVGLLWSGSWQLCQAAVEAVLNGAPIAKISSESAASTPVPPFHKACSYDIRHISKDEASAHLRGDGPASAAASDLHRVRKGTRPRFKRQGNHCNSQHANGVAAGRVRAAARHGSPQAEPVADPDLARVGNDFPRRPCCPDDFHRPTSNQSSASQASDPTGEAEYGGKPCAANTRDVESRENESMFSAETAEASMVTTHGAEQAKVQGGPAEDDEVELELTLGFEPAHHSPRSSSSSSHSLAHSPIRSHYRGTTAEPPTRCDQGTSTGWNREMCSVNLGLHLAA